jgi:protein-L-isoaspartate(D-aspartate) O-methyltransferase
MVSIKLESNTIKYIITFLINNMTYETSRIELIKNLILEGRIKTKEVEKAFLETPREIFVPESLRHYAYVDSPLDIGNGQTISAPHMVAIMVEELDIKKGQKILEVGAGSGYHATIVSKLVGKEGHIYTVERFSSLADNAKKNLKNASISNVTIETGDGSEGLPKYAPYDRIYVTCAAPKIPPPLLEQLKDQGKLMVPVGKMICSLELIIKKGDKIISKDLGGCAFVPLVGKYGY